ncbi:hypothetical protein ROR02_26820 [Pararhodospirillum oryzae]|uniref:Cytoskeleton protein RodZ-like C-terminal domain-containing protein n=1 Tax=Pararhodospirillum oryzae TaxID=478448 RepID=A0A512HAR9_9PROT|nr:hypothetical protein ROR02_26820 [Pararhodospirillum oryzae]
MLAAQGEARVVLRATSDSWILLRRNGALVVRRLLRKGDVYAVPDAEGLTLSVNESGGVEVYVDGRRASGGGGRNGIHLDPNRLKSGH